MIRVYEDEQLKFQGFEDYIKYVTYGDGGVTNDFDDYESALECARDYEDGRVEKITYDHNGDEIDSELIWGGYRVIAKEGYGDGSGIDNCGYDDILVYEDGEFRTGSGHEYSSCTTYADYANYLLGSIDTWDESTDMILNSICSGMNQKFGGNWDIADIRGSVQGEYATVIYNKDSHKNLEYFEDDYFNRGCDYDCYVNGEYEVTVWVGEYDEDKTLGYIADATGYDEDEIWIERPY